jgi:hypothetical protein
MCDSVQSFSRVSSIVSGNGPYDVQNGGALLAAHGLMASTTPADRRKPRIGVKVFHRHRVAGRPPVRRVSELVFATDGRPKAVLEWIDLGGMRTPLYICELDPAQLRRGPGSAKNTYYTDQVTDDPRFLPDA